MYERINNVQKRKIYTVNYSKLPQYYKYDDRYANQNYNDTEEYEIEEEENFRPRYNNQNNLNSKTFFTSSQQFNNQKNNHRYYNTNNVNTSDIIIRKNRYVTSSYPTRNTYDPNNSKIIIS